MQWLLGELLISVTGVEWEHSQHLRVCRAEGEYLGLLNPRLWLQEIVLPEVISTSLNTKPQVVVNYYPYRPGFLCPPSALEAALSWLGPLPLLRAPHQPLCCLFFLLLVL